MTTNERDLILHKVQGLSFRTLPLKLMGIQRFAQGHISNQDDWQQDLALWSLVSIFITMTDLGVKTMVKLGYWHIFSPSADTD